MVEKTILTSKLAVSLFLMLLAAAALPAATIYVDDDANGLNNGTSWQNAYKFLQDALADADSSPKPIEIRVAQGIYRPDEDILHPSGTGNSEATFQLINSVTIKGGYAGAGTPDPNTRDIVAHETTLDGVNSSYHVVTGSGTDETATLDGFTITGGYANEFVWGGDGGGIYCKMGNPTINNCLIFGNLAYSVGGGMYNIGSSPKLTNCQFNANSAGMWGGGMSNNGYIGTCSPTLTNCTFNGNSAYESSGEGGGGAMYNVQADPILTNCTFSNNWCRDPGGGIYNGESDPILTNCIFTGNEAMGGGGVYNYTSNPKLSGCKFSGNSARYSGGGMYNDMYFSTPIVINCVFSGNRAYYGGGMGNHHWYGARPIIINCTFSSNRAQYGGGICFNWPSGLTLSIQAESSAGQMPRPLIYNCIMWGDTAQIGPEIALFNDSSCYVLYSNVQGGAEAVYETYGWELYWGPGNIDVDPCFAVPGYWDPNGTPDDANDDFWVDGDYHLKSQAGRWDANITSWVKDEVTSLCIDAGDLASPIGLEPFPNGGIINMGAYGGTSEASKSYFGKPVCETIVAGDINGDCKIDYQDLFFLSLNWLSDNRQE